MGKGKRKIEIEKIEKEQYRMVTFSKRRKGLFKKAEEFNSKTGSSIALLVLSQAGRPYVFGAPSFDAVADHFLATSCSSSSSSCSTITHSQLNKYDLVSSAPNSLSTTPESNDPEPWWLQPCEDGSSQASTSYANDVVCSSVLTDSKSGTATPPQIQNMNDQWGVWLDDKFGIEREYCETTTVEELVEMKNTLVQLRQSVASKILCRHGPETFFI